MNIIWQHFVLKSAKNGFLFAKYRVPPFPVLMGRQQCETEIFVGEAISIYLDRTS
jgi:hypothetical protein